jgi:hypothetical protein
LVGNDRPFSAGVGRGIVRQARLPIARDQTARRNLVDVLPHRERHHVGANAVDHRPRLPAGTAMRLVDRDLLAVVGPSPLRREGAIDIDIKFAGRIVRDVEQRDRPLRLCVCARCGGERANAEAGRDRASCKFGIHFCSSF